MCDERFEIFSVCAVDRKKLGGAASRRQSVNAVFAAPTVAAGNHGVSARSREGLAKGTSEHTRPADDDCRSTVQAK
jgi:hypothetical protein